MSTRAQRPRDRRTLLCTVPQTSSDHLTAVARFVPAADEQQTVEPVFERGFECAAQDGEVSWLRRARDELIGILLFSWREKERPCACCSRNRCLPKRRRSETVVSSVAELELHIERVEQPSVVTDDSAARQQRRRASLAPSKAASRWLSSAQTPARVEHARDGLWLPY